jgi:hypothetical protein
MHCGAPFNAALPATTAEPAESGKVASAFGWSFNPIEVAIWIVAAVGIYVLLFVLFTHPVHLPLRRLFYAYIGLSLSTACLIFVDAENLDTKVDVEGFPELTALHWLLLTLFLWPVGFALYMLARAQFGEVKLIRAGLASGGAVLLLMLLSATVAGIRSSAFFRSSRTNSAAEVRVNGQPVSSAGLVTNAKKSPVLIISSGTQVIRR